MSKTLKPGVITHIDGEPNSDRLAATFSSTVGQIGDNKQVGKVVDLQAAEILKKIKIERLSKQALIKAI